jgi:hypothetical protein
MRGFWRFEGRVSIFEPPRKVLATFHVPAYFLSLRNSSYLHSQTCLNDRKRHLIKIELAEPFSLSVVKILEPPQLFLPA